MGAHTPEGIRIFGSVYALGTSFLQTAHHSAKSSPWPVQVAASGLSNITICPSGSMELILPPLCCVPQPSPGTRQRLRCYSTQMLLQRERSKGLLSAHRPYQSEPRYVSDQYPFHLPSRP